MVWPVFPVWVLRVWRALFLHATPSRRAVSQYRVLLLETRGVTPPAFVSVSCKDGVARLRVRGSMRCTGSVLLCALHMRATAAPVGMDCLVYRKILNLIPGFDSDEEFGPFCHHTPFLGDGLGLMTFAFCKLSLIFPVFARLHDNASFGSVGW